VKTPTLGWGFFIVLVNLFFPFIQASCGSNGICQTKKIARLEFLGLVPNVAQHYFLNPLNCRSLQVSNTFFNVAIVGWLNCNLEMD
jgi:hypothetical protein